MKPRTFEQSLASHPKSEYWNYELNGNTQPKDVCKGSDNKYWFNCNK